MTEDRVTPLGSRRWRRGGDTSTGGCCLLEQHVDAS